MGITKSIVTTGKIASPTLNAEGGHANIERLLGSTLGNWLLQSKKNLDQIGIRWQRRPEKKLWAELVEN